MIACLWGVAAMKSSVLFASGLLTLAASVRPQSGRDAQIQAVDICTITANPANYDGKEFLVRGLWRMVIHGSILMGKVCPMIEVNRAEVAGYEANKKASSLDVRSLAKKDQFGSVEVVFRGTFRVAHDGPCFWANVRGVSTRSGGTALSRGSYSLNAR